jgi:hypothetical protein
MMMWFTKIAAQVVNDSITRSDPGRAMGVPPPFPNSGSDPEAGGRPFTVAPMLKPIRTLTVSQTLHTSFYYAGALFSIIASLESTAGLVASIVWPLIFPFTLEHNLRPGTAYTFMAALGILLLPLVM